jgi:hypothetical protein
MLHLSVSLLSNEKTLDEIGFAGAQVPLTRTATVTIGGHPDRVVVRDVRSIGLNTRGYPCLWAYDSPADSCGCMVRHEARA